MIPPCVKVAGGLSQPAIQAGLDVMPRHVSLQCLFIIVPSVAQYVTQLSIIPIDLTCALPLARQLLEDDPPADWFAQASSDHTILLAAVN